jgi:hypothetical protein
MGYAQRLDWSTPARKVSLAAASALAKGALAQIRLFNTA